MKIQFRGWRREVIQHDREVIPVTDAPGGGYMQSDEGEQLEWEKQWDGKFVTRGRLEQLGLSGDFIIKLEFSDEDLKGWLKHYVNKNPKDAIRLLAEMQAEAILNLHTTEEPE